MTHSGAFTQGVLNATYSVIVTNDGGIDISGSTVTVTENVPTGLTLVSMSGTGWICPTSSTQCTRNDALTAGTSYPLITVTVKVASNSPASVVNQVSAAAGPVFSTANDPTIIIPSFSRCDLSRDSNVDVSDIQQLVNESLGAVSANDDLSGDGIVNVVDVQIVINAALNLGCSAQ